MRFLLVALGSLWRPKLRPADTSIVTARVWPTDVDVSAVNNAAYLVFFEMGRLDLQLRTGLARLATGKGWVVPMASINVQFRKPLRRFQRFQVRTRLLHWDDRCVYVEQRIERAGDTMATAVSRSVVLGKEGRVPPLEMAAALGFSLETSSRPPLIEKYDEAEGSLRELADRDVRG